MCSFFHLGSVVPQRDEMETPMEQIEVPREHWRSFAEAFSGEHHGWLVTVADADTAGLGSDPHAWPERWHPLHEGVRLEALVLRVREQDAPRRQPVAAGPTDSSWYVAALTWRNGRGPAGTADGTGIRSAERSGVKPARSRWATAATKSA